MEFVAIKELKYVESIHILNSVLHVYNKSRPALSLLGYCYYATQDFVSAADCYEQLILLNPEVDHYRLYYAQSLHKANLYDEAMKISCQIDNQQHHTQVVKLQAAIKYGQEDFTAAKNFLLQCTADDLDTEFNKACVLFKEGAYTEALHKFQQVLKTNGFKPDVLYGCSLCQYMLDDYASVIRNIGHIIANGTKEHPELAVGLTTDGVEVRSVGNTITLHETALIEAFNLQAAVQYRLKEYDTARMALTDMPPRSEQELDPVTLHNQAIMNIDLHPSDGLQKLQFLLQREPFPPDTFANLLLLYVKYEYYDLAADVLAEHAHLTYKLLSPYLYAFLEALIVRQTAPDEAYKKLDALAAQLQDGLRKALKQVDEGKQSHDDEHMKRGLYDYDQAIRKYTPVLMQQAKIYWDMGNYRQVERIFHRSYEFCRDEEVWKLNVAHVLFMQENKYKDAVEFYEPIIKTHYEKILDISAIVLANLCVSYIMTNQRDAAEELMRKVEKDEERMAYENPDKKMFHLCIINLVIGTMYCAKGNFEFGIQRVMKSMEPYQKKLGADTWYYAKRCFLALIENLAKHMIMIKDSIMIECLQFLQQCEIYGRNVKLYDEDTTSQEQSLHPGKNTITYESRLLKYLLLELS